MSRAQFIERKLTTQELLEATGDPELVSRILLEVENSEPKVEPSGPEEDLDLDYFKRRRQLIRRLQSQEMYRRRRVE